MKQLVVYHSLMLLWKVKKDSSPKRLVGWLERKRIAVPRIDTMEICWLRTTEIWGNQLDIEVIQDERIGPVKTYLKDWVKTNVQPFDG